MADETEDKPSRITEIVQPEEADTIVADDGNDTIEGGETETEEVVVQIGDQAPPEQEDEIAKAPEWVRELRKSKREADKRVRELEAKLAEKQEPANDALRPEPQPEDHDYDNAAYAADLKKWVLEKAEHDKRADDVRSAAEKQQEEWQAKLSGYETAKRELPVPDFDDAEDVVKELFDVTQQGIIIQGSDNPALVFYALGKNEKQAKDLAALKGDPVRFAFAVAKLEAQLKITKRSPGVAPEKTLTGGQGISGTTDNTLDRLRDEAARTGNTDKLMAYKRSKRVAA